MTIGKSTLRVHARGPKRYELDECARVKPFLYMHAQLSSLEKSLKFSSQCARSDYQIAKAHPAIGHCSHLQLKT